MINKKLRKKIAYLVLFVFLPLYIILAVTIINYVGRMNIWIEFITYVLLGIIWIYPFKFVFKGLASR
ncbi:MAG: DUF2842 domain-containing protein [Paracoccaceae bacterium]